jgi:glycosyltransferase involved in cell wall biosynthesis
MRLVFNLRDQDRTSTKSLGILNVSLRLLPGLAEHPEVERVDVFANRSLATALPRGGRSDRICRYHFVDAPAPRRWARLLWDQWSLVRRCNALVPDWLLLPKGFGPLFRWPRARVSAYVHDNVFGYYASHGLKPFPLGEAALFHRGLMRVARRAALVVTNSNFTRDELIRDFAPCGRVVRIGAPLEHDCPPMPGEAPDAALVVATSPWPHKLTKQAIAWLQRWEADTGSKRTVHGYGALPANCAWPNRANWHHHGRVDDAQLHSLHRAATLIYFSAYEGFGLPPVESAAQGFRVVASDLPPLRETMPASALFDNRDYASFHRTLNAALASPPVTPLQQDLGQAVAERWVAALAAR